MYIRHRQGKKGKQLKPIQTWKKKLTSKQNTVEKFKSSQTNTYIFLAIRHTSTSNKLFIIHTRRIAISVGADFADIYFRGVRDRSMRSGTEKELPRCRVAVSIFFNK